MVRVLQGWEEIGEAVLWIQERGLVGHACPQKNWDFSLLGRLLEGRQRECTSVIDLGCADLHTLSFCLSLGFRDLSGVDRILSVRDHAKALRLRARQPGWRRPFHLVRGDLLQADKLFRRTFGVVTCISVLEHGVPAENLCAVCARLLEPGGIFFLTTDYAENMEFSRDNAAYGLPWTIQNRTRLNDLIEVAARHGLTLLEPGPIPPERDHPVFFLGQRYTFAALAFVRST